MPRIAERLLRQTKLDQVLQIVPPHLSDLLWGWRASTIPGCLTRHDPLHRADETHVRRPQLVGWYRDLLPAPVGRGVLGYDLTNDFEYIWSCRNQTWCH